MTLDQIINVHDTMVGDVDSQFPKPLPKEILTSIKPQLHLVSKPKVNSYYAEDYLEERLESFFEHIVAIADVE